MGKNIVVASYRSPDLWPLQTSELVEHAAGPPELPRSTRVQLMHQGQCLAAVTVAPAEREGLPGRAPHQLIHSVILREPVAERPSLLPLILYLGLRRARIWGRHSVAAIAGEDDPQVRILDLEPVDPTHQLRAQRLDLAMHRAFTACDDAQRGFCGRHMLAEARELLARHARRFADTAWVRAVKAGRLGRAQYVATLASTHQYVRYTPRLLARAVAVSQDEELREHFLHHLDGERRHDRLIEADLRHLGADVDYVRTTMAPSAATMAFMVVQESMIGFHQDPILFLAAPFVAEGLAAGVDPEVLPALASNIRAWGLDPMQATRFLRSHVHLDGGDDGHWQRSCDLLSRRLGDEPLQQRFLAVVQLAADAFVRGYDGHIDDLAVFSPNLAASLAEARP